MIDVPFVTKNKFQRYYCHGCHMLFDDLKSVYEHQHVHTLLKLKEMNDNNE